jgi:hypothetical protein
MSISANQEFRVGDRVELRDCPGPGTIVGAKGKKVLVCFDDFAGEPPKTIRPENLQMAAQAKEGRQ